MHTQIIINNIRGLNVEWWLSKLLILPFAQGNVIKDGKSVHNWCSFLEAEVRKQVVQTAFCGLPQFQWRIARTRGDVNIHKGIRTEDLVPGKVTIQTVLSNPGNARELIRIPIFVRGACGRLGGEVENPAVRPAVSVVRRGNPGVHGADRNVR